MYSLNCFAIRNRSIRLVKCNCCGPAQTVFGYSSGVTIGITGRGERGGIGFTVLSKTPTELSLVRYVTRGLWKNGGGHATLSKSLHRRLLLNRGIAGGLCLCQLLFHSLLRPPPIYIRFLICRSCRSPLPLLTLLTQNPMLFPLFSFQPDLTQYTLPCARDIFVAELSLHRQFRMNLLYF